MASLLGELSFIELTRGTIPLSDFGISMQPGDLHIHTTHFSGGPTALPTGYNVQGTIVVRKSRPTHL